MSKNKSVRQELEKIYGPGCMVERAGIRYIPIEERKQIKGYKKSQEKITYHHIKEKSKGGPKTVQNGALVKGYNHTWIHQLDEVEREGINKKLQEFKLSIVQLRNGKAINGKSIDLDFNIGDNCITIPVYSNSKKRDKRGSAKKDWILREEQRKENKYGIQGIYKKQQEDDREI